MFRHCPARLSRKSRLKLECSGSPMFPTQDVGAAPSFSLFRPAQCDRCGRIIWRTVASRYKWAGSRVTRPHLQSAVSSPRWSPITGEEPQVPGETRHGEIPRHQDTKIPRYRVTTAGWRNPNAFYDSRRFMFSVFSADSVTNSLIF